MCSSALANFFIEKAKKENIEITNLKLQKLMFIAYGWTLALLNFDLTEGEGFQAWQHGPVLPSVYHQMKYFRDGEISSFAMDSNQEGTSWYAPKITDRQILEILEKVWEVYKNYSAWSLRNLTHKIGTPWDMVYRHDEPFIQISFDNVKSYYYNYLDELLG